MNISLDSPDIDAQALSEQYMEDDMVYHLVGFCKDNLNSIIVCAVSALFSLFFGIYFGTQRASIIKSLKKKYENIEHLKVKTRNYINFLLSFEKFLFKLKLFCPMIIVGLISNLLYHYGFSTNVILRRTVSRDICIGILAFFIVISIVKYIVYRMRLSEEKYYRSIDLSVTGIAEQLETNLGPKLVHMLKQRLVAPKKGREVEVQVNLENREIVKAEQDKLRKEAELESLRNYSRAMIGARDQDLMFIEKDLARHKAFMQGIVTFAWCDYCSSLGDGMDLDKIDEIKEKPEEESKEEGDKGKQKEKSSPEKKEEEGQGEKLETEEPLPTSCVNNCIQRYFTLGKQLGQDFKKWEDLINASKIDAKARLSKSVTN